MTTEIALTLGIILAALILFATERIRVDVVALLVLIAVSVTGLVSKDDVFLGFANPAVVTVWAVYIVSGGLFRTGVADYLGSIMLRLSGPSEVRLILVIMIICGVMSAFMNNVGAVAVLMPAVIGVSRQAKVPASKLLIPLAFSSLMGGGMTLIGTPANILAAGVLSARGLQPFGFFEITPLGMLVLTTGIIYMIFLGRRLLPIRQTADDLKSTTELRDYISEVRVLPDSPLNGNNLYESGLGADYDLTVISIIRDDEPLGVVHRDTILQPNDHLILEGPAQNLLTAQDALKLLIEPGDDIELADLDSRDSQIFEATLSPRSTMAGHTLNEIRFRDQFGFTALAIWRQGEVITTRLRDVPLEFGDALLLQGPSRRVAALREGGEFLVLEPVEMEIERKRKAPLATAILATVIILAVFTNIGIATAMVIGSVSMVLTGCLSMDEAYESIDWRTVFLVGGMLSLGIAMENTGTAEFLADVLLRLLGGLGPVGLLGGIYILSAMITQPMSNAAAVVLMVPIAIDTAFGLEANYITFTMAVVIGASTSFLTPVGHKANVLVFGPGGYRFLDYARVGALLTVILFIVSMIFLPIFWPLYAQ